MSPVNADMAFVAEERHYDLGGLSVPHPNLRASGSYCGLA